MSNDTEILAVWYKYIDQFRSSSISIGVNMLPQLTVSLSFIPSEASTLCFTPADVRLVRREQC